ncbi:MAG: glycine cleavage system protein H [Candidatus Omnitrophica bacterium CG07_land_8_20_14_0_80_50_8]|nr:MAG: glycine cleavage system protein H [Candidatus Omnitrophica bacterium CG07_land_8_20_14_0_80_50_8]
MIETSKLKYTETHEWVNLNGKIATVGISDYAQKEISDVVFIELPKPDKVVKQKESAMVIESVKAAFDIYAPLSGKVIKVNEGLKDNPELVNQSPYDQGWLFQIECSDLKEAESLLTETQYTAVKDHAAH